jgi:hypothetical protein
VSATRTGRHVARRATGRRRAAGCDRYLAADDSRHADGLSVRDLFRNLSCAIDVFRFADLTADRVRHFAGSCFRNHRAGGERNFRHDSVWFVGADRVRNASCASLAAEFADGVRNPSSPCFLPHRADRVGNLLRATLFDRAAGGVGNSSSALDRAHPANLVRDSALLRFPDHAGAHDGFLRGLWNPDLSASSRGRSVHPLGASAAGTVNRLAFVAVPVPSAGRLNAVAAGGSRTLLDDGFPLTAANVNLLARDDWSTLRVADFAVSRFRLRLVRRVALLAVAGFVNRLADLVVDGLVAGFVNRLADVVTLVAVTGLCERDLDRVLLAPKGRLPYRLADGVTNGPVARFVFRPANLKALFAELRFVDVASALDRFLLTDRIPDGLVSRDGALVIDDVLHRAVTRVAGGLGRTEISARGTR